MKIAPFRHCNTATKSLLAEPLLLHEFREKGSRPLLSFIRSADKHRWTDVCIVQTSSNSFTWRYFNARGCAGLKVTAFILLRLHDPLSFWEEVCNLRRAVSGALWDK